MIFHGKLFYFVIACCVYFIEASCDKELLCKNATSNKCIQRIQRCNPCTNGILISPKNPNSNYPDCCGTCVPNFTSRKLLRFSQKNVHTPKISSIKHHFNRKRTKGASSSTRKQKKFEPYSTGPKHQTEQFLNHEKSIIPSPKFGHQPAEKVKEKDNVKTVSGNKVVTPTSSTSRSKPSTKTEVEILKRVDGPKNEKYIIKPSLSPTIKNDKIKPVKNIGFDNIIHNITQKYNKTDENKKLETSNVKVNGSNNVKYIGQQPPISTLGHNITKNLPNVASNSFNHTSPSVKDKISSKNEIKVLNVGLTGQKNEKYIIQPPLSSTTGNNKTKPLSKIGFEGFNHIAPKADNKTGNIRLETSNLRNNGSNFDRHIGQQLPTSTIQNKTTIQNITKPSSNVGTKSLNHTSLTGNNKTLAKNEVEVLNLGNTGSKNDKYILQPPSTFTTINNKTKPLTKVELKNLNHNTTIINHNTTIINLNTTKKYGKTEERNKSDTSNIRNNGYNHNDHITEKPTLSVRGHNTASILPYIQQKPPNCTEQKTQILTNRTFLIHAPTSNSTKNKNNNYIKVPLKDRTPGKNNYTNAYHLVTNNSSNGGNTGKFQNKPEILDKNMGNKFGKPSEKFPSNPGNLVPVTPRNNFTQNGTRDGTIGFIVANRKVSTSSEIRVFIMKPEHKKVKKKRNGLAPLISNSWILLLLMGLVFRL